MTFNRVCAKSQKVMTAMTTPSNHLSSAFQLVSAGTDEVVLMDPPSLERGRPKRLPLVFARQFLKWDQFLGRKTASDLPECLRRACPARALGDISPGQRNQ